MDQIRITELNAAAPQLIPARASVSSRGGVETVQVLGDDRPIHLWKHRLAAGAQMRWGPLPVGRIVYLWAGSLTANNEPVSGEGAMMIEHGAVCGVEAGAEGCELVEFQAAAEHTRRLGGQVHVLSRDQAPHAGRGGERGTTCYADSSCPTCEMWLHESSFPSHHQGNRHFHDQDEVIICTRGTMMLGTRAIRRGGVLSINRNAVYSFGTADEAMTFINFRPGPSTYVRFDKKGKQQPPQDEQTVMRSVLAGAALGPL